MFLIITVLAILALMGLVILSDKLGEMLETFVALIYLGFSSLYDFIAEAFN